MKMANFAETQNLKVAAQRNRSTFNLSHKTITTQDFSVLRPISVKEVVPGDSFSTNVNSFVRLAPLPCPTYGDLKLVNRGFFVPYRTIMLNWREFEDNAPATTFAGVTAKATIPVIYLRSIFLAFVHLDNGLMEEVVPNNPFDFKYQNKYFKFTYTGRRIYTLLVSLGYQIYDADPKEKVSLLPILAYAKLYYDWYLPSPFVQGYFYLRYFQNSGNVIINTPQDAYSLINNLPIFEPLEKDYFTSAFLEPFGNPSSQNRFTISSPTFGLNTYNLPQLQVESYRTVDGKQLPPILDSIEAASGINALTQYGLDTLKAVDQFVKRNQIAGNRYHEQHLARYGVNVSNALANRSEYLGYNEQRISIGEVMSTADTMPHDSDISNLGSYAGRGVGSSVSRFKLDSDEFGLFFVVSCIQVTTGYPYGYKRELVKHIEREDFFIPEYDSLGNQPIARGELYSRMPDATDFPYSPESVFGWSPRYSEYKCSLDFLHGDFLFSEFNEGMDSWHLFRDIDGFIEPPIPDMSFISGDPNSYANNFDRIFSVNTGQDHFIAVHDVNIKAYRKMRSLSDSIVTEGSEDVSVGYNGRNF